MLSGVKPEITEESRVIFEDPANLQALESREWLKSHRQAYGPGPFVVARRTPEHVVLLNDQGKIIRFGSTADPAVNVGFFRRFDEQ